MDPGPQAVPPQEQDETLEVAEIMAMCDPVFQHLAFKVAKDNVDPSGVSGALAAEMERLLSETEELQHITKGLFSPGFADSEGSSFDKEERLNYE